MKNDLPNLAKREIVTSIHRKNSNKYPQKKVAHVVQATIDTISDALKKGRNVELRNFGIFEPQIRKARPGRNPNKPDVEIMVPRRVVVKFKTGKELREAMPDLGESMGGLVEVNEGGTLGGTQGGA